MLCFLETERTIIIISLMTLYGLIGGLSAILSKKGIIQIGGLKIEHSMKIIFNTLIKLIKNPLWFIGAILGIVGFGIYFIALQNFEISIIKPLVNTNLVFTFIFAYITFKERLNIMEWVGVAIIISGMILLGLSALESADKLEIFPLIVYFPILIMGTLFLGLILLKESIRNQEFFYAVSAGFFYGIGAIFTKAIIISMTLELWVLIYSIVMFCFAYIVAIISQQFAFNSGRLSIVGPITNSISVVIPVISSEIIFYEPFSIGKIIGLIFIIAGVFLLRRDILSLN